MVSKVFVEVGCITGVGASRKAATDDAIRQASEVLTGTYRPCVIFAGTLTAVVWREAICAGAWCYTTNMETVSESRDGYLASGFASRDEAIRAAKRHIAQLAFNGTNAADMLRLVDPADRRSTASWLGWQLAIIAGREAGVTGDENLRAYANEHQREFEPAA